MSATKKLLRKVKVFTGHPYVRFIFRRAILYLIVTFAALTLIFALPRMMPGDPISIMLSKSGPSGAVVGTTSIYEEIRSTLMEFYGFDKPMLEQYKHFWEQVFSLDLGVSFTYYPKPVSSVISSRVMFTLVLVIPVFVISFFLGNWIGARAAFLRGIKAAIVYYLTVIFCSMPSFWFGMILMYLLGVKAKIFPIYGWSVPETVPTFSLSFFFEAFRHYLLPFLTLLIITVGGWALGMRSMVLYEINSDYMFYAEQLGFRKGKLRSYAQRNAILPQFTGLNLTLSNLIGATALIESIFGWPGIGSLLFETVWSHDYPLMLGSFMIFTLIVIVGNFLIDISYGLVDPRIRTGHGR